ncbi:hypothetical protein HOH45_02815 [bacterium]|jgi:hypothetical protein|nr:hypothetical protein [bacterium]
MKLKNEILRKCTTSVLSIAIALSITGCSQLIDLLENDDDIENPSSETETVNAYVIGAPWGMGETPNGYVGTLSTSSTGDSVVNKTYFEISKTANKAKLDDDFLYVLHSGSNSLYRIDTQATDEENRSKELSLGTNLSPWGFVINNETAYITNNTAHSVTEVSLSGDMSVVRTFDLPSGSDLTPPEGEVTYAYPQDIEIIDNKLYVALTNQNSSRFPVGPGKLAIIDLDTNETSLLDLTYSNPASFAYSDLYPTLLFVIETGTVWPADNLAKLEVIDTETNEIITEEMIESDSSVIEIGPEGTIYVASGYGRVDLYKYTFENNLLSSSDIFNIDSFGNPTDIEIDDEGTIYVSDSSNHKVFVKRQSESAFSSYIVNDAPMDIVLTTID